MEFWFNYGWIIAVVLVGLLLYYFNVLLPKMQENDLKRTYQSAAEPDMIWQRNETQEDFWATVERERARYVASGNRWALRQNPVIPFPKNAAFTVEWFGKKYDVSTVGLGNSQYMMAGQRFYFLLYAEYQKQVTGAFDMAEMMEKVKEQDPFDPATIWKVK